MKLWLRDRSPLLVMLLMVASFAIMALLPSISFVLKGRY